MSFSRCDPARDLVPCDRRRTPPVHGLSDCLMWTDPYDPKFSYILGFRFDAIDFELFSFFHTGVRSNIDDYQRSLGIDRGDLARRGGRSPSGRLFPEIPQRHGTWRYTLCGHDQDAVIPDEEPDLCGILNGLQYRA